MKTPLLDAVEAFCGKNRARFHMPGHKGYGDGVFATLMPFDITEVDGADSLFHADGAIAALEGELAALYGARSTLLSAGGATLCIQTMLSLACRVGGKVIMSRNIHRSAVNACALLDLTPVWIYPQNDAGDWFSGRYSPEGVRQALDTHPDATAVYITSPDYFGVMSEISGIAEVCRERNVFLLVDNAHGAHLKFLPAGFGAAHPLDCGASACADSLHKTMPAMTGGALLHIADARLVDGAKEAMSLFGSTSPSYPIMLSCEQAGVYGATDAHEGFAHTADTLIALAQTARERGFALPQGVCDPCKLSLGFGALGLSDTAFAAYMRDAGIEPEYISGTVCVLMGNAFNTQEDYKRLCEAIEKCVPEGSTGEPWRAVLPRCEAVIGIREAVFAPREQIPIQQALGRIAAIEASPCPPGIPLVMSGERIDAQAVEMLARCGIEAVWVVQNEPANRLSENNYRNLTRDMLK